VVGAEGIEKLVEAMGVEPMSAISRALSPTCVSLDYTLKQKQEHLRLRAGSVYDAGYTHGKVLPTKFHLVYTSGSADRHADVTRVANVAY
jgi:hypothetical protein